MKKKSPAKMTGAADPSASEMYEQCLPVTGKNFSPKLVELEKKNAHVAGAG